MTTRLMLTAAAIGMASALPYLAVRDACSPQPAGAGPITSPDTAEAFSNNSIYVNTAVSAPTPQGYSLAFARLSGSTSQDGYMGSYNLQTYDTIQCQEYCDSVLGCNAFNIFYERDPSVDPGAGCDNPPSTVNIKCILWNSAVTASTAVNQGGYRNNFHIVIAASNGYVKDAPPPPLPSFTGPVELGGSISAPLNSAGKDTYTGFEYHAGAFDPSKCASGCLAHTQYDHDHPNADGTYQACNFFNAYVQSVNNVPQGTYCTFYTQPWDRSYATNYAYYAGQWAQQGNYNSISQSYGYSLTTQDPGVVS
ncbi:uncharacterized protein LTR77_000088 [Saxophila tyrrhenica]|uniref:Uncharacterized protein n=1 Tax=Saxophila tyrrhenica TaxID=1690608 RepID=A0AAV9PPV6_9PEZI|nr:hypothetical protein LTR77_000088 [Saxophila tyrrhenica]